MLPWSYIAYRIGSWSFMVSDGWYCSWCSLCHGLTHQLNILNWTKGPWKSGNRFGFVAVSKGLMKNNKSPTNTSIPLPRPWRKKQPFPIQSWLSAVCQPRALGDWVFSCLVLGMATDVFCMAMAEFWPPIVVQVRMSHMAATLRNPQTLYLYTASIHAHYSFLVNYM